jgi:hypothetical protein
MKFRSKDKIIISLNNTNNEFSITLGPVINRNKFCWSYYQIYLMDKKITFDDILNQYHLIYHDYENVSYIISYKTDKLIIDFKTFKKMFKIDYITELTDQCVQLSEKDLLEDLDFIKKEIVKCRTILESLKQKEDHEKYNFYDKLLNEKQYTMFQFDSLTNYENYINKISQIIDNDPIIKEMNQKISENMNKLLEFSLDKNL